MVHSLSVASALKLAAVTVVQTFWIFCENSSLHGLRYIGRNKAIRGYTPLRFVWSVIAVVSLAFTLFLSSSAWEQFRSNPTLTTIETTSYPVSLIAFPAVTLCNINKIHSGRAEELQKNLTQLGINGNDTIDMLYSLPRLTDLRPVDQRLVRIEAQIRSVGYDIERLAFEVAPPCESMLVHCFWQMQPVQCRSIFRRTKIFAGYCCSFNADRFLEPIFTRSEENPMPAESIHVTGIGKGEGLSVLVDIGEQYYTASNRFSYGIEVFVHRSFDFPDFSDYTAIVQRGMETDVSVLPTIVSASPSLRSIALEKRGCAFQDEGNSSTSVPYTYSNCMNECELRYTASICRCLPLYKQTVDLQTQLKVPICGFRELACLPEFNFSAYGVLHVHFRSTNCLKYRREPFVTWQTLVATFGGILGLCFGGSILSLFEALFFFGIIPFTVYRTIANRKAADTKPTISTISYMDYPGHQPMGYFRRREVMARTLNGNDDTMWAVGKRIYPGAPRWKQHHIDELKIIP
uniref:Sodium channel protein Nach n=1 Tax=Anopheles epiroticus TaxID=199890 RepID=A0A182PHT5_9DIPT